MTEARSDNLPCTSQALNPGVPFSTRKPRILFVFAFGPDHGDIGDRTVGDPHFFAVQNVLVASSSPRA